MLGAAKVQEYPLIAILGRSPDDEVLDIGRGPWAFGSMPGKKRLLLCDHFPLPASTAIAETVGWPNDSGNAAAR